MGSQAEALLGSGRSRSSRGGGGTARSDVSFSSNGTLGSRVKTHKKSTWVAAVVPPLAMKEEPKDSPTSGGRKKRNKEDKDQLMGQCVISLMARQRAVESCIYTCVVMDAGAKCCAAMRSLGKKNEKLIQQHKQEGKKWRSSVPIHVAMFCAAMEAIVPEIPDTWVEAKQTAQNFMGSFKQNIEQVADELRYFRRMSCYDEKSNKLLWYAVPGTTTAEVLENVVLPFLVDKRMVGAERKFGQAPRSSKERRLIKAIYTK